MRLALVTLTAAVLSTAALAQTGGSSPTNRPGAGTSPPSAAGTQNPAVDVKPAGSPQSTGSVEPGANSFTEAQARSRIEAQGFQNVTDLRKDDQGIWRGKAQKDGRSASVMLDFRGNVSSQ